MGSSLPPEEANLFKIIVKSYETKQYKKDLKAADTILKKFPEHGESLLVGIDKSWKQGSEDGKAKMGPLTTPMPPSQVLGKVKDFLGVMAKANEKLELEAENSHANYDIEVLSENEQQYIEMDLLLGVADLHTPEAVAAAEANMSGFGPSITSAKRISADIEDDSDEDVDNTTCPRDKFEKSDLVKNDSSCNNKPNKQPKIVVLD